MDFELRQRGRASVDFAADLGQATGAVSALVRKNLRSELPELADDLDERLAQVDAAVADSRSFGGYRQLGEWLADQHGRIAIDAYEEIKTDLEPKMTELSKGTTTLELDPNCAVPDYFKDVWFHRTTGGWDGHDEMGFIHGEIIHKRYVAKNYPGDIFTQRGKVLEQLPRTDYKDIFEVGSSSGHFTVKLAERFPQANITGCDISAPMLRHAHRTGNELGHAWRLLQVPGEATGLPDESFDLVTHFIILHEVPASAARALFEEAFRLLRPGGHLLTSDVRAYRDMDKHDQWHAEYLAVNGGEPYWREAASLDLAALAKEVGFVDARSHGLGDFGYPWVTFAAKPE